MYWKLRSDLTACIAADRLILLDVERDRYSGVPSDVTGPAIAWLHTRDGSAAPSALLALVCGGSGAADLYNANVAKVTVPQPDSPPAPPGHATLRSVLSVGGAVLASWTELRTQRLGAILKARAARRAIGSETYDAVLRRQSQIFAAARRWCPIRTNCLLDSLAFDRWLGSPKRASLVFGVLGQPFEAHCWVQSESDVLNDSYDRVSRFEPILRV